MYIWSYLKKFKLSSLLIFLKYSTFLLFSWDDSDASQILFWENMHRKHPSNNVIIYSLADTFIFNGKSELALPLLKYLEDSGRDEERLFYKLGLCYYNLGQNKNAKEYLNRITKHKRLLKKAYRLLGKIKLKQNKLVESIGYFNAYLKCNKKIFGVWELLDRFLFKVEYHREIEVYRHLEDLYLKIGNIKKSNYIKEIRQCKEQGDLS